MMRVSFVMQIFQMSYLASFLIVLAILIRSLTKGMLARRRFFALWNAIIGLLLIPSEFTAWLFTHVMFGRIITVVLPSIHQSMPDEFKTNYESGMGRIIPLILIAWISIAILMIVLHTVMLIVMVCPQSLYQPVS